MGRCRTPVNRILMMRKRNLCGPMFQRVAPNLCAKSVGSFYDVNGPGGVSLPAFYAATTQPGSGVPTPLPALPIPLDVFRGDDYEALPIRIGEGPVVTAHSAPIWAADYLGLYREFGTDEPVWKGGRKVENLATYSADYSNAAWAKSNITATASTLTASAANGTCLQTYIGTGHFAYSVELSRITGTGDIDITVDGGTTWTTVALTTSYQRIVVHGYDLTNPQFGIRIVTDGDAVNIKNSQLEDITAETLYRTRTESPELVTDGGFDTACGVNWTCGDGWSIGSGVASCDGTQTENSLFYQAHGLGDVSSTRYLCEFDVSGYSAGNLTFKMAGAATGLIISANGHYQVIQEAGSGTSIVFTANSTFVGSIDNVTVKELVKVAPGEYVPTTTAAAHKVFVTENGNVLEYDPAQQLLDMTVSATSPDPLVNLRVTCAGHTWAYHIGNTMIDGIASSTTKTQAAVEGDRVRFYAGDPADVTLIYCYSNNLTGSIPDFSSSTALNNFRCNNNQLTGNIPDLSSNTALAYFQCYSNQLTGNIPDLSSNTALVLFSCRNNQLTGFTGGWPSETTFTFTASTNALTETAVNLILTEADAAYASDATGTDIDISGGTNAAPTGAGAIAKASLIAKGATVTTN